MNVTKGTKKVSETTNKQLTPISSPILQHSSGVFPEALAWNWSKN